MTFSNSSAITKNLKISILCENASSDVGCLAEWGFSAFIEFSGQKILFDSGFSHVYKHNAERLNIDLDSTDFVVLSHFHADHTRGLFFHIFTSKKKVICHPDVLKKLPEKETQLWQTDFELSLHKNVFEFSPGVFFLGHIPRLNTFERGRLKDDSMDDDSAIAIATPKGVVVISGCSHAGICNICEYAKRITNLSLYAVVGGFHLFEKDPDAVEGTLDYFQKEKPSHLFPMHCVDFPTLTKFYQLFRSKKYSAGDVITLA